jgi:hypothetical protein
LDFTKIPLKTVAKRGLFLRHHRRGFDAQREAKIGAKNRSKACQLHENAEERSL